jgi:transposase-like protein
MYRSGIYPETPDGVSEGSFRSKVRQWKRLEDTLGPEALKPKSLYRTWSPEEKLELIMQVRSGKAVQAVSIENRINDGMLHQWLRKYNMWGYNGLIDQKKGRKQRNPQMKKININNPRKLEESEYEELVRLRAEIR